jgi:hypothetical protein
VAARPFSDKFSYLNNINLLENQDYSNYNALQMTVNERPKHGLSFLAAYTYSRCLDIESGENTSTNPYPIDAYNVRLNYGPCDFDITHRFTLAPTYNIPGIKSPGQMLQGWTVSGIVSVYSGLPWFPDDVTDDLVGTGEFNNAVSSGVQTWNYSGTASAFKSGPTAIPCFGSLPGCSSATIPQSCITAAQAPYAGNAQLQQLALAALNNLGCYVQGAGVLTPPAFGTIGNASRNMFRAPSYHNVDFSVAKDWHFTERFSAQFRAEFFNVFNWANFGVPGANNPAVGLSGQFGCSCTTPDVANTNPVLGSGGPRHIQFGLKLTY